MSVDKQKGRADAAKGDYRPPKEGSVLIDSDEEIRRRAQRRQEYREGYYEKKEEMKNK